MPLKGSIGVWPPLFFCLFLEFYRSKVVNDLVQFVKEADVIVANRMTYDIIDVADKVYTRDLFGKD